MNNKIADVINLLNLSHVNTYLSDIESEAPYYLPQAVNKLFQNTNQNILLVQFNQVLLFCQLKINENKRLVIGPLTTQDLYYNQPFKAFSYLKNSNKYIQIKNITDRQTNFKVPDLKKLAEQIYWLLFNKKEEASFLKRQDYSGETKLLESKANLDTSAQGFISAISHGDKDQFLKMLSVPEVYLHSFMPHAKGHSKEDIQKQFYGVFLKACDIAIKQGVSEDQLGQISEKYFKILDKDYQDPIKVGHLMANMILEIIDKIREQHFFKNDDPLIKRIYNFVNTHYQQALTRNLIAEKMNVSPTYLSTYFKKKTGQNLSHFIQIYKINKAEMLLEDQNNSVIEISNYLGFNNVTYFNRIFKKITGQTPSEYRNSH